MEDDDPDKVVEVEVPLAPKKRPRREVSQASAVHRAEMYVSRNLPKYLKKLEELAMGVALVKPSRKGEPVVYVQAPDRGALEYLVDRGMGKAPQRFEIQADAGNRQLPQAWVPDELPEGVVEGEVKELPGEQEEEQKD